MDVHYPVIPSSFKMGIQMLGTGFFPQITPVRMADGNYLTVLSPFFLSVMA
jgi:hypothetical protein